MIHATGHLCALASLCLFAAPMAFARADTSNTSEASETGVTSFHPVDFERYNPSTALDMVSQVPGFSIDNGDDVRGFGGAAGNVLIDDERPSSKSNLQDFLRRIPAANVERVDLVRGASGSLDMQGQTRVVNVILKEGVTGSQLSYEVAPRMHGDGRVTVEGTIDWTGKWLGGDLTLSLANYNWAERNTRPERRYDADGNQIAFRDEIHQPFYREVIPGFEYERDFGEKTTLRLNGRYWEGFWHLNTALREHKPDRTGPVTGYEFGTIDEDWAGWDFGGDVEYEFSEDLSSKLIWYNRRMTFESESRFDDLLASGDFLGAFEGLIEDKTGESILRSQTSWELNDKHALTFGIEGAYNFVDADRTFLSIDAQGNQPDMIPVSTTKVEEYRGEAFISDVWNISERWTIEPGMKVEVSEISQSGDATATRTFTYPKPSLSATFTPSEGRQWRFLIERRVAQLDFGDFVSNVNASDDRVTSGNPDLEPERAWRFDIGYERPLLTDGNVSLTARYEDVEQVQDLVPIMAANGDVFDGPGNLGDGYRFQLIGEAAIPTDFIGLKNGRLDLEVVYRHSEVEDPLTGENRRFAFEQPLFWYAEYRQDFPEQKWSWGFDYSKGSVDRFWRSTEDVRFERGHGDFDIYVETTRFWDINIRVGVDNAFDPTFVRTRTLYADSRADGIVSRRDIRDQNNGQSYYIRFKGTFG